ncbi:helix-turn-helix domain-containing protein [Acrocarpospora macrocephala]|uniref:Transcriptional regulator n=1 Tax=Acrocarpospora macrocephala TaxID=150177 RepID=A0A5M3X6I5_9ACTN|nr:transcriptional regulator [Acrocarpospora macrocephala]
MPAAVWLWPGRALYTGPSLRLGPHSGAVTCVVASTGPPFVVRRAALAEQRVRTALIAPRVRHHITAGDGRMVFLYLDAGSASERACRAKFTAGDRSVLTGHRDETAILAGAAELSAHTPLDRVASWIIEVTGREETAPADPRIDTAIQRLLRAGEPLPAELVAAEAGLSESRFLRLFRQHTGTSYRRFRLWAQMRRAAASLAEGGNLTRAAADGYFASPSHFSTAFHALFGLTPSALLTLDLTIRCVDA